LDRNRARILVSRFQGEAQRDVLSLVEDRSGALWIGTSGKASIVLIGAQTIQVYRHNEADAASLANNTVLVC